MTVGGGVVVGFWRSIFLEICVDGSRIPISGSLHDTRGGRLDQPVSVVGGGPCHIRSFGPEDGRRARPSGKRRAKHRREMHLWPLLGYPLVFVVVVPHALNLVGMHRFFRLMMTAKPETKKTSTDGDVLLCYVLL